jgi:ABC-type anion transport system duplicated permease subunit
MSFVAGLIHSRCLNQVLKFHVTLFGTGFIGLDNSVTFLMFTAECRNCVH